MRGSTFPLPPDGSTGDEAQLTAVGGLRGTPPCSEYGRKPQWEPPRCEQRGKTSTGLGGEKVNTEVRTVRPKLRPAQRPWDGLDG